MWVILIPIGVSTLGMELRKKTEKTKIGGRIETI